MPTPTAVPRRPYSHVENSRCAELDWLGLTALRALVDVQPYGCGDLGSDPSDDEPPSLSSASPSEGDDPQDSENPSDKKKKKKRKSRRHESRSSKEGNAIATLKIGVNMPEFTGKDLSEFQRVSGQTHASGRVKCDRHVRRCVGCP